MEAGQVSVTAIGAAIMRAAHLLLDDEPKIFEDPFALSLSGAESEAALLADYEARQAAVALRSTPEHALVYGRYSRANMAMRQRYTEEALDDALTRGVAQYVILGAGLDSFAYRTDLGARLRVFEVDHPATQAWKCARLRELRIELPGNLTFVPLDFEQQTLAEGLAASGHRPELQTFVSWLGVTMYLSEEAVFQTLGHVATFAPDSEIVFQYIVPAAILNEEGREVLASIQANVAAQGEAVIREFEPVVLAARVRALGFRKVWDFGPKEADARYFAGRTDGLRTPPHSHLMRARV
jgi:methyltransferase (TIGR00027 family)